MSAPTAGQCSRCLEPFAGSVSIYLTELFAYPDSATEATTEEDEVGHVVDDAVDPSVKVLKVCDGMVFHGDPPLSNAPRWLGFLIDPDEALRVDSTLR